MVNSLSVYKACDREPLRLWRGTLPHLQNNLNKVWLACLAAHGSLGKGNQRYIVVYPQTKKFKITPGFKSLCLSSFNQPIKDMYDNSTQSF